MVRVLVVGKGIQKGKFPPQTPIRERDGKKENWGTRSSVVDQGSPPIRYRDHLELWGIIGK